MTMCVYQTQVYAQFKGLAPKEKRGLMETFTDAQLISEYAIPAMTWAFDNGIIQGRGNGIVDPLGKATRAEIAAVLHRYCELIAK